MVERLYMPFTSCLLNYHNSINAVSCKLTMFLEYKINALFVDAMNAWCRLWFFFFFFPFKIPYSLMPFCMPYLVIYMQCLASSSNKTCLLFLSLVTIMYLYEFYTQLSACQMSRCLHTCSNSAKWNTKKHPSHVRANSKFS